METRNPKNKLKKKLPFYKKKLFWISVLVPIVLLLFIAGYYWYKLNHFASSIQSAEKSSSTVAWTGKDRVNILLLGVDNRNNDPHPRSDVNLIVSIDPKTHTAQMMSVLRDTLYKIPGYSQEKINAAYSLGGADLAVKTFSDFLQIPINYYAITDFQGFEKVVDAVGGIDLNVEKDMDYVDDGTYDIHLKKGFQHLDGQHALMYVRFRHDAMADFTRTERQRNFLKALSEKMKQPMNLIKLPSILDAMQPYVKTNMTMNTMIQLGSLAKDVDWSNIKSQQIPDMKDLTTGNVGDLGDCVIANVYNTRVLVHQLLGMNDTIQKDPSIEFNDAVDQTPTTDLPKITQPASPPSNPFGNKPTEPTTNTGGTGTKTGGSGSGTGTGTAGGKTGTGAGSGTSGSGTTGGSSGTGTGGSTGTGSGGTTTGGSAGSGHGTGSGGASGTGSGSTGGTGTGNGKTGGTGTGGTSGSGTGTTGGTGSGSSGGTGSGSTGGTQGGTTKP